MNEQIFENSRFSIMKEAVCITSADGRICFKNESFSELFRNSEHHTLLFEREPGQDEISDVVVKLGRLSRDFKLMKIRIIDDFAVVFADTALCGGAFPVMRNSRVYACLDTLASHILIPILGGRVLHSTVGAGQMAESTSDFEVGYYCLDTIVYNTSEFLKNGFSHMGYRIDADIKTFVSPVCKVNLFDFMLSFEILTMVMARKSDTHEIGIYISQSGDTCSVILKIPCNGFYKRTRMRPDMIFEDDEPAKRSLKSLIDFCALYSWKLVARADTDCIEIAFSLPAYNHEPVRFRNETQDSCIRAGNQIALVLNDDYKMFLK